MGIDYLIGTEGACIQVENVYDLYDAIDTIHSQVLKNVQEDGPVSAMVSRWLDELANYQIKNPS